MIAITIPIGPSIQLIEAEGASANFPATNKMTDAGMDATRQRAEETIGNKGLTKQATNPITVIGATMGSAITLAAIE
jgi:hypothetical protein